MRLTFFTLILVLSCVLLTKVAWAQTMPAVDLTGYAWSSNIGWISLNCENDNNCTTSDYKVTINADRTITGYAWSSNIGWIKFGGLSNFPVGSGTTAENARLSGTYPNLTWNGWARACSGTSGGNCSSMANNGSAGSWDGWISLRGTNYSVTADMTNGMNTNSYAWGSDVVGWVDMFSYVDFVANTASISGTGCTIGLNSNTCSGALSWSMPGTTVSPNIYNTRTASQISTNLSQTNAPVTLSYGNTIFHARSNTTRLAARTLSATCGSGLVHNGSVCVAGTSTAPTITFEARPPFVRTGNTTTLQWSISTLAGSSCVINAPGIVSSSVSTTTGSVVTGPIRGAVTATLTCTGAYGTEEERVTIEVIPVAEEV